MTDSTNKDDVINSDGIDLSKINYDDPIIAAKLKEIAEAQVAEQLKDVKSKLDNAYSSRDDALAKLTALEKEKKDAEMARLKEEGKHRELYELQLKEEREAKEALRRQNVELTRDAQVRAVLSVHPFKNAKASEMAYQGIVKDLVQKEDGTWVYKTGESIAAYVDTFVKDDSNSFLFKAPANSGSNSSNPDSTDGSDPNKIERKSSLFDMSQADVLKLAAQGKLNK
jgi:flagellar biosynthesis GTPase FlhF